MHLMHLPFSILLASFSAASVLDTTAGRFTTTVGISGYAAILEAFPFGRDASIGKREETAEPELAKLQPILTKDNTCGNRGSGKNKGFTCDPKMPQGGSCCSSYGHCGDGPSFCGTGCQDRFGICNKPFQHPAQCGPRNHNKKCSDGQCCSANGFCVSGKSKAFCGVACQPKFGYCEPKPKPSKEHKCGPSFKNLKCPDHQCCSSGGNCGIGKEFCSVPQNCLRGFGRCDSDSIPNGPPTQDDPRPQLGSIPYSMEIYNCTEPGTVALTFDDGPTEYTNQLLNILEDAGAKATFFVAGNINGRGPLDEGDEYPAILHRMVEHGHQIASHTWSHPHMDRISSPARRDEMAKNERAIANVIGKYPTYMRPPYGECSIKSGCVRDLNKMGYHRIQESLDSKDYKHFNDINKAEKIVEDYLNSLGPDGAALISQHDTLGTSVNQLTQSILLEIREKGWRPVTVGECLADPMQNWYREPKWVAPGQQHPKACIVSRHTFCGDIKPFANKQQCFASVKQCYEKLKQCGESGMPDTGHSGCREYKKVCTAEFIFCNACGMKGKRAKTCETKNFQYKTGA